MDYSEVEAKVFKISWHSYKTAPGSTWQWENRVCYTCFMGSEEHADYERTEAKRLEAGRND